jgi:hypothetical protein
MLALLGKFLDTVLLTASSSGVFFGLRVRVGYVNAADKLDLRRRGCQ